MTREATSVPRSRPARRVILGALLVGAFLAGRLSLPVSTTSTLPPSGHSSELVRSFDQLEATLTESRAQVDHNVDLRRRHEQVTEIACRGAESHARDSARIVADHERRRRKHLDEDTAEGGLGAVSTSLNGRRLAAAPETRARTLHSP